MPSSKQIRTRRRKMRCGERVRQASKRHAPNSQCPFSGLTRRISPPGSSSCGWKRLLRTSGPNGRPWVSRNRCGAPATEVTSSAAESLFSENLGSRRLDRERERGVRLRLSPSATTRPRHCGWHSWPARIARSPDVWLATDRHDSFSTGARSRLSGGDPA
jgi:hypothetical protein